MAKREGEINKMRCGLNAKIIKYTHSLDIDVQFEDGKIKKHQRYARFKEGTISYPKERLGEENLMKCGKKAKIIAYRSATDVDVKFENGAVRKNISYAQFKSGAVKEVANAKTHLHEKRIMNCGKEAEIINYRNVNDIDIRFEDGKMREHVHYDKFKKGEIGYPIEKRLNEKRTMSCGLVAEIIAYRSATDMDIKFENGTIREHVAYNQFKRRTISHIITKRKKPDLQRIKNLRIGEENLMSNGKIAKVIDYRGNKDIDIEFDDGVVVKNVKYCNFVRGLVRYPQN